MYHYIKKKNNLYNVNNAYNTWDEILNGFKSIAIIDVEGCVCRTGGSNRKPETTLFIKQIGIIIYFPASNSSLYKLFDIKLPSIEYLKRKGLNTNYIMYQWNYTKRNIHHLEWTESGTNIFDALEDIVDKLLEHDSIIYSKGTQLENRLFNLFAIQGDTGVVKDVSLKSRVNDLTPFIHTKYPHCIHNPLNECQFYLDYLINTTFF